MYPVLKAFIAAAVCFNVGKASIITTPIMNSREDSLIGWADHLTLVSTNRSITFENAGSSEMGRCILYIFFLNGINFGARPLPYALKNKVDVEIDRLLAEKIIEPVEISECAAPVVPILKKDETI